MSLALRYWRTGFLLIFIACAGMIGFALYHQIYNWVMPCLMCVYQRLAIIIVGLLALLAAVWQPNSKGGVKLLGGLIILAASAGAMAAIWNLRLQYGPVDPSVVCAASLPFPIDLNQAPAWVGTLIRPVGDCSAIDFKLFGVTMPAWVLLTCLGLIAVTVGLCSARCAEIGRRRWR
ncbi:disulfide bond formation protein B [Jeongeupia naejangsanensis]|uniref:Disulfide bond formation protein B n=1 Tax=Jeongeupia naejangsanensis TaxID=613195 RepID=A0ABS2BGW5_9NEIS|nr:disulfide bond formation protein B [Jeongeupia naejangsanensis]MBM3114851.1 disulfide bond formation protein B [Jeongeupia naejangsanensis]